MRVWVMYDSSGRVTEVHSSDVDHTPMGLMEAKTDIEKSVVLSAPERVRVDAGKIVANKDDLPRSS